MIFEVSGSVALGAAGFVGAVFANALALVRIWHRIELRLTVIETRMAHIERNTSRGRDSDDGFSSEGLGDG
jgi:hypothetical protein